MPLITYDDVAPYAVLIDAKVAAGEMPRWLADRRYGSFVGEPTITPDEVAILSRWVEAGAPEGAGSPPTPTDFVEGWSSEMGRPPDVILDAPFGEVEVPLRGEIPTFTAWLELPFQTDVFVEALELRPTNRAVVHHASVSLGPLPPGTRLGTVPLWNGGPAIKGVRLGADGQPSRATMTGDFGYPMLFYVPGGGFLRFPDGIAKRIRPDDQMSWGMHLIATGRPETVGMQLGLWFPEGPPTHEAMTMTANVQVLVSGDPVPQNQFGAPVIPDIPAGASNWEITGVMPFEEDVTLYALWPHMHYRGKDMTFYLVHPDGREEILLSVPRYDFNWQTTYMLTEPLKIAAGSEIRATAHYDNSASNPFNPDPTRAVIWGEQSWNEMFYPFLEVSFDRDVLRVERPQGF